MAPLFAMLAAATTAAAPAVGAGLAMTPALLGGTMSAATGLAALGTTAAAPSLLATLAASTLMPSLATAATIGGAALSAKASMDNADAAEAAADANKRQADALAGQQAAVGQRHAAAAMRKSDLMLSRAQAIAASSGGGPLDDTLAAGILTEGLEASQYALYSSQEQAASTRYGGELGVWSGRQKAGQYRNEAYGSLLSAGTKAFQTGLSSKFAPQL